MSAHDHASPSESPGFIDEDEDLFDFPRVELTLEGLRNAPDRGAPGAPTADPLGSVAAPLPAAHPATSPVSQSAPALSSVAATVAAAPAPVEEAPPPALTAEPERRRRPRRKAIQIALIVLFVLNGAGFWFLWRTHVSFGAGIDNLRTELDDASKRLERARREAAARSVQVASAGEATALDPLDALERSSLALAENEIKTGEYGAARRRLNRLLALSDRMNPSLRAEIEPRATFLVARSYEDEADARRRSQR